MNLIQLVSEQTMQNLLPLLAIRPEIVIQVRSSGERFRRAGENLKQAVAWLARTTPYQRLAPEFHEVVVEESSPSADQTRRKVGEALSLWPGAVVNLTGGTKPMALGAFLAAQYQYEPVLYCDTQERRFISLNEKRPLPNLPGFEEIAATLTVEAMLAAHGVRPERLRSVRPTDQQVAFACGMQALHQEHSDEVGRYASRIRDQLQPNRRAVLAKAIDGILAHGLPGPDTDIEQAYLKLGEQGGLLTEQDGKWLYRLTGNTLRPQDRLRAALAINKTLLGGLVRTARLRGDAGQWTFW